MYMGCPYQDSLGIPGKGVHTHLLGVAIFDVLATIVVSEAIVFFFGTDRMITFLCLFFTGIVLHRVFCVRTTIDKYLFP
jgi:hypothetical protein